VIALLRRNLAQALRERRLGDARLLLDQLKEQEPLAVETRGSELELLLLEGRLDEAQALARQLLDQFPASARVHFLGGQLAYRRRAYSQAADLLTEAEHQSPNSKTRHWLGKALTQAGRLEEAEAVLVTAAAEYPPARSDLAWLYERMERPERAIEILEAMRRDQPDNDWVTAQLQRLRARGLTPDRVQEEVETLVSLGEEIPDALLPEYLDSLLAQAQVERARALVAESESRRPPRTLISLAWVCHRRLAPDLACHLFLRALPEHADNAKLLAALEADALKAGRAQELGDTYRTLAPRHPALWGRLRNLMKRLAHQSAGSHPAR
jgi:tetratricopeptide (TPR) repeat protein